MQDRDSDYMYQKQKIQNADPYLDINRNYVMQSYTVTQVIINIQKRHSKTSIFALTKKDDIAIIFLKQKAL